MPLTKLRRTNSGLADDVDPRSRFEDLVDQLDELQPGQRRTQAEVRSAAAERHVGRRRRPTGVEAQRIIEHRLVEVGRGVPHDDLVAGRDLGAGELGVGRGGPPEVQDRRRVADDLLGRRDAQESTDRPRTRSNCSAKSARCSARCDIADRVVSFPAKIISRKKLVNSASVRRSPSTSASMSLVTRSSVGRARRRRRAPRGVVVDAVRRRAVERQQAQLGGVAVGRRVERFVRRARDQVVGQLDHEVVVRLRHAHDVADHPDRDRLGDRARPSRRRRPRSRASRRAATRRRMAVGSPARGVGVNAALTRRRRRVCIGGSRSIIDARASSGVGVDVVDLDVADLGGVRRRVAAHLDQVGVAGHRPEARAVAGSAVPEQPGRCPDRRERVMGDPAVRTGPGRPGRRRSRGIIVRPRRVPRRRG